MSDLEKYSQLLTEQSVKGMNLAGARNSSPVVPHDVEEAIRKRERIRIAAHLLVHYRSRALSLMDIAIATGLSIDDVYNVVKEYS